MDMDIVQIISQVGFPIAVTTFILVKVEKTMQKMTNALNVVAAKLDIDRQED